MIKNLMLSHLNLLAPDNGGDAGSGTQGADDHNDNNASGGNGDSGSGSDKHGSDGDKTDDGGKPKAKYTDDDVNEIINRKFAEWQKKQESKASQAQRLQGMSDEERAIEEAKNAKNHADELQKQIDAMNMRDTARGMFSKAGVQVSEDDLQLVVTPEADSTKGNVNQLLDFAKRIRENVQHEFLNGDHLHDAGSKHAEKAGSRGAQLAKSGLADSSKPNPYFGNNTK